MMVFDCAVCRRKLSALPSQVGSWVLCPSCRTKLQVPVPASELVSASSVAARQRAGDRTGEIAGERSGEKTGDYELAASPASQLSGVQTPALPRAGSPPRPPPAVGFRTNPASGKRYGFNCGYCSSRLEATESMAAQEGQCPTCGNSITIPIQDRYGRLIDPKTRQIIKQDPHPVHAYAAAGDRAPDILRQDSGKQIIRCARCKAISPITANNCKACGMPFTMEGTTLEAAGSSNGFAVAGLVMGIIGLPTFFIMIPSLLACIFGAIGYSQISKASTEGGGKGMAITGICFGAVGLMIGLYRILG